MSIKHIDVLSTWEDFIHKLKTGKRNIGSASLQSESDGDWAGSSSMEQAISYLENGWHDGMRKVKDVKLPKDIFEAVMPVSDYKPELKHVVSGGVVDVGTYLSGASPECFIAEREGEDNEVRGSKLVTIYYLNVNHCGISTENFLTRGACVYQLVEHLEMCGFSTEVIVVASVCSSPHTTGPTTHNTMTTYLPVKTFREMLDLNKLCCMVASAFSLRRFSFAMWEMAPYEVGRAVGIGSMYGYPYTHTLETVKLPQDKHVNPLLFNMVNIEGKENIIRRFREILQQYLPQLNAQHESTTAK
jgi:hypothetical protein